MVIGALDVDRTPVPAPPFVEVIRDIRQEVRVVPTPLRAAAHDAILVVPERGRAEKQRTVLLERVAGVDERIDGLVDLAVAIE
ncbi:hypothetical protein D3C83_146390 [compost metagenome]